MRNYKREILEDVFKKGISEDGDVARVFRGKRLSGGLNGRFAEILDLVNIQQSPKHHPEGNVFRHTMLALTAVTPYLVFLDIEGRKDDAFVLFVATLYHDIGKAVTKNVRDDGRITFYKHEKHSSELIKIHLKGVLTDEEMDRVVWLAGNHMRFTALPEMKRGKRERFMAERDFDLLVELHRADAIGSNGDLSVIEFIDKLKEEEV